MVFNLSCSHTRAPAPKIVNEIHKSHEINQIHIYIFSVLLPPPLNRCRGNDFNIVDALDTSVFGILWHCRWIGSHWRGADTMVCLLLWLHRRCQAIGSNMIWSWMVRQRGRWRCGWKWRRNYWADRCIFTRLAAVWQGWWHRLVNVSTIRFRRRRCVESEYVLQGTLLTNRIQDIFQLGLSEGYTRLINAIEYSK